MNLDVVTVAEGVVYQTLKAAPAVAVALPRDGGEVRVYPEVAPAGVEETHVAHDIGGAGDVAAPMGGEPVKWTLPWDVTAWIDGQARQALGPVVTAVLVALCGDGLRGRRLPPYDDGDGGRWAVAIRYVGPIPAPGDFQASGVWRRVAHRISIELSPYSEGSS